MKKEERIIFKEYHIEIPFSGWTKILNVSKKLIIPYHSIKKVSICSYPRPDLKEIYPNWLIPKRIEGTFFYNASPCYISIETGKNCLHIESNKGRYRNVFIEDDQLNNWLVLMDEGIKKDKDRTKKRKLI